MWLLGNGVVISGSFHSEQLRVLEMLNAEGIDGVLFIHLRSLVFGAVVTVCVCDESPQIQVQEPLTNFMMVIFSFQIL